MRPALTTATRVTLALVAAGVVVQVFLAGYAIFGDGDFDAHKSVGGIVHGISILTVVLAIAGPRTRLAIGGTVALAVLNTVQIFLSESGTAGVAALHPTLALAVLALAGWLAYALSPGAAGPRPSAGTP